MGLQPGYMGLQGCWQDAADDCHVEYDSTTPTATLTAISGTIVLLLPLLTAMSRSSGVESNCLAKACRQRKVIADRLTHA